MSAGSGPSRAGGNPESESGSGAHPRQGDARDHGGNRRVIPPLQPAIRTSAYEAHRRQPYELKHHHQDSHREADVDPVEVGDDAAGLAVAAVTTASAAQFTASATIPTLRSFTA